MEFFTKYDNKPKAIIEKNSGECLVDLTGFLGDNARLAQLLQAGQILNQARRVVYDREHGAPGFDDDDYPIDPTSQIGFSGEEANILAGELADRFERQKLLDESKRAAAKSTPKASEAEAPQGDPPAAVEAKSKKAVKQETDQHDPAS